MGPIISMAIYWGRHIEVRYHMVYYKLYSKIDSFIDKKVRLCQMFVNPEWQRTRYARIDIEVSKVENLVMR